MNIRQDASHLDLVTDVLIIGGGPAGTWAASPDFSQVVKN